MLKSSRMLAPRKIPRIWRCRPVAASDEFFARHYAKLPLGGFPRVFPLGSYIRAGDWISPRLAVEEAGRLVIMNYLSSRFISRQAEDTCRLFSNDPFKDIGSVKELETGLLRFSLERRGCKSICEFVNAKDKDCEIDGNRFRQALNSCFENRAIRRVLVVDASVVFREEILQVVSNIKAKSSVPIRPCSVADLVCLRFLDKGGWPHLVAENVASELPEVLSSGGARAFKESVKAFGESKRREFTRMVRWANIFCKSSSVSLVSNAVNSPHNFCLDAMIGSIGCYFVRFWNYHGEPSLRLHKEALMRYAPRSFHTINSKVSHEIWSDGRNEIQWDVLKLVKLAYMEAVKS